jgi:hypothetical protein
VHLAGNLKTRKFYRAFSFFFHHHILVFLTLFSQMEDCIYFDPDIFFCQKYVWIKIRICFSNFVLSWIKPQSFS